MPIQMSDLELKTLWAHSLDSKTAKYNCDQWMTKHSYTDSQSPPGTLPTIHWRVLSVPPGAARYVPQRMPVKVCTGSRCGYGNPNPS